MSREEAVNILRYEQEQKEKTLGDECSVVKALDMAIQALQYMIYVEDDRK